MIQLTRLNNTRLAVNSDLIKYVEEAPDTVITLLNGEKLVVRETTEQVIGRVRDFRRSVLCAACGTAPESAENSPGSLPGAHLASVPPEGPERG
jgi:flagellar protein FlbD